MVKGTLGQITDPALTNTKTTSFSASNGGIPIKIEAVLVGKWAIPKNVTVFSLIDLSFRSKLFGFGVENTYEIAEQWLGLTILARVRSRFKSCAWAHLKAETIQHLFVKLDLWFLYSFDTVSFQKCKPRCNRCSW